MADRAQARLHRRWCRLVHPSFGPTPSAEDILFTRRMAEAGEVVGVRLVDHLIVTAGDRWVSLKERGAW